jgi:hypothetical protein
MSESKLKDFTKLKKRRRGSRDLLIQLELALEREQELWKDEDPHSKSVHAALGAMRTALDEVLEEE